MCVLCFEQVYAIPLLWAVVIRIVYVTAGVCSERDRKTYPRELETGNGRKKKRKKKPNRRRVLVRYWRTRIRRLSEGVKPRKLVDRATNTAARCPYSSSAHCWGCDSDKRTARAFVFGDKYLLTWIYGEYTYQLLTVVICGRPHWPSSDLDSCAQGLGNITTGTECKPPVSIGNYSVQIGKKKIKKRGYLRLEK